MSIWRQALRADRLTRFVDVARREGIGCAVGKARAHVRLLRAGRLAPGIAQTGAAPCSRFSRTALWTDLAKGDAFHVAAPGLMRGRRSVALIGDLNLPQCRKYRVEQMVEFWASLGIEYRYAHVEDVPRCLEILQDATHLVIYRLQTSDFLSMYLYEARRLRLPVLYDIDDPLFSISALADYSNMAALGPEVLTDHVAQAPLYLAAMSMADAVSAATPTLAEHAGAYTSRPIWLRRNFADAPSLALGARAREAERQVAGFSVVISSGSKGRSGDLEVLGPALRDFLARDPARRVVSLGHLDDPDFAGVRSDQVERRPFTTYGAYLEALAAADVVLVPLSDDLFNRCKSAVRALDAGAVGRATVVSDVGDLPVVVRDGKTGIVAATPDDWAEALEMLAKDRTLCAQMGRAAFDAVRQHWTVRNVLDGAAQEVSDWALQ